MYLFLIVTGILISMMIFIINKAKMKRQYKQIIKVLLVVIALEIYVFNFNSLRLIFKNYNMVEYYKENFEMSDIEYDKTSNSYRVTGENPIIEIKDINEKIATINLDIELDNTEKALNYRIRYTDETSKNYRELPTKTLVTGNERSKYVTCYLSGESNKIEVQFDKTDASFKINNISINKSVPFEFNFIRALVLFFTIIFVKAIFESTTFNTPYEESNKKQKRILSAIICAFEIIVIWTLITSSVENSYTIRYDKYFVDAILSGKTNLLQEPSEELTNLENPYDITQRENIDYLWDVAYYNNSYYIYFGILPALILFVPYKIFTGEYLPLSIGILLFSIIILFKLAEIMCLIYKKWFKKLNFNWLILALISILSGSLVFWVNRRPYVYELVLTAGICFCTIGFTAMFKALYTKDRIVYKELFKGALSLALAVACRPNLLLVSLIFLPEIIKKLKQNIKNKENVAKFILTIGVPYIVVGILLMIYNYIRFDSIFEFRSKISVNC